MTTRLQRRGLGGRDDRPAVRTTTDATFAFDVVRAKGLVLVDFFAGWCPTCRRLDTALDDLADTLAGRATVVKVDVEKSLRLAERYRVMHIPTLLLLDGGTEVTRIVGVAKLDRILDALEPHLEVKS